MKRRGRVLVLIGIMIFIALAVGGTSIINLYSVSFQQQSSRLREIVQSRARFVEAVARHAKLHPQTYPQHSGLNSPEEITLSQIRKAHTQFKGFGKTGEFTLAKKENDQIVFLISRRHISLEDGKSIPFDSGLAEPMRLALSNQAGIIVGKDYRGVSVLAAYEPVKELNYGIVAKIDLEEIRKPFIKAAAIGILFGLILTGFGAVLFLKISEPILHTLKQQNQQLKSEIADRKKTAEQLKDFRKHLEQTVAKRTRELSETVEELEALFRNSRIGIASLRGGRVLSKANQRLADILGFNSPDELIGVSFEQLHLSEQHYHEFNQTYLNLLLSGEVLHIEYQLKKKNSSTIWCSFSGKSLDTATPTDLDKGVLLIVDDISERKDYEFALLDLTRKLGSSQEMGKSGWWEYDVVSDKVIWPAETFALYGLDPKTTDLTYDKLLSCIHPQYHDYHDTQLKTIYEKGEADFQYPIFYPGGDTRWIWARGEAEYNAEGKPIRLFGVLQDITDRMQIEEQLRLQSQILDQIHDSVISVDMNGLITSWNHGSEVLFQYEEAEAIGQHVSMVYPEESHRMLEQEIIPNLIKEGSNEMEVTLIRKDSQRFEAMVSLSVLKDKSEHLIGMIGYTLDISKRKQIESELNDIMTELERSNSELEQFAYVASHDLQEPLRAVVGFLQLLESRYSDQLDEKGKHYIDRSVKAGHRMQNLIEDLLSLSRINTRAMQIKQASFDDVVQTVRDQLHIRIEEKEVEISCTPLPILKVDINQIQRLFQNLISNAIKYNNHPNPRIEIGFQDKENQCLFYIKDNGIGIAPEFHDRIFMIFQRLYTKQEYSGTGIGLALCKKIVERHGGTIWVESKIGEGSTFYFTIPKMGKMV